MRNKAIFRTLKSVILLISILFGILLLLFGLLFSDFKEKAFFNATKDYQLNIDKYTNKLESKIFLFDKNSIDEYIKEAKNTEFIENVKVQYKRYFFNKENLIFQTKSFSDVSWNLADITIDAKFGEIRKINDGAFFEFIPSSEFNLNENLIIKYQLFKNNEIKSFIVPIDLNILDNKDVEKKEFESNSIYEYFYNLKIDESIIKELKIDDLNYATIEYTLNDYNLKKVIYDYFIKLLILVVFLFLPIMILLIYYHRYLENKYVTKPIRYLDNVVSNIVENKFFDNQLKENLEEKISIEKEINELNIKILSGIENIKKSFALLKQPFSIDYDTLRKEIGKLNLLREEKKQELKIILKVPTRY